MWAYKEQKTDSLGYIYIFLQIYVIIKKRCKKLEERETWEALEEGERKREGVCVYHAWLEGITF